MNRKQIFALLFLMIGTVNLFAVPMIEVSVDIIEIKQTNNDLKGVSWNETINFEEGLSDPTYFNFANATKDSSLTRGVASNFSIGAIERFSPLAAALRLMITNNQARILANPKLATESGSQASFIVGGEIPVPVVSPQGTSIEWKTYGINLQVRPNVVDKTQKVSATIQVSISDLDYANSVKLSGYDVPALLNRSANSKVTVSDGGTIVIAGLKQARKEKTSQRVPFLSKIPLFGWFFRSTSQTDADTSMVVFVTFKIVGEK